MPNLFQTFLNKIHSGYTQLRDKIAVPAIDGGMAAGIIPASAGMFGRYLTGTSKPLTRAPADIRKAESWRAQAMPNPNNYIADDQSVSVYLPLRSNGQQDLCVWSGREPATQANQFIDPMSSCRDHNSAS